MLARKEVSSPSHVGCVKQQEPERDLNGVAWTSERDQSGLGPDPECAWRKTQMQSLLMARLACQMSAGVERDLLDVMRWFGGDDGGGCL